MRQECDSLRQIEGQTMRPTPTDISIRTKMTSTANWDALDLVFSFLSITGAFCHASFANQYFMGIAFLIREG